MKTCKYGCGGKMKEGGKVATMKKMKVGGNTADPCFPLCLKAGECKPCLSTRLGDALVKAGTVLFGKKVLKDAKKNAENKKKTTAKTEAAQETVQKQKMGGVTKKKYAMGGNTGGYAPAQMGGDNAKNGIYGIPNAGRTDSLGFKKGGIAKAKFGTSVKVQPGKIGKVTAPNRGYKSIGEREPDRLKFPKFKSGGSLKPVPADKVGLAKLPTTVRNKMGFQKKGGVVKKK